MFELGFALTQVSYRGVTISQWNGLCGIGLAQFTGPYSADPVRSCRLVAGADRATGWLIGAGLVLLAGYAVVALSGRRKR